MSIDIDELYASVIRRNLIKNYVGRSRGIEIFGSFRVHESIVNEILNEGNELEKSQGSDSDENNNRS